jgi:hypothetical protein
MKEVSCNSNLQVPKLSPTKSIMLLVSEKVAIIGFLEEAPVMEMVNFSSQLTAILTSFLIPWHLPRPVQQRNQEIQTIERYSNHNQPWFDLTATTIIIYRIKISNSKLPKAVIISKIKIFIVAWNVFKVSNLKLN